jgi:hypothetical protein
MKSASSLQPVKLMENVALAVPETGMSPSKMGYALGGVTTGEQCLPSICVSVKLLISVV